MSFRGKRLGFERRIDDVEDVVEGIQAAPPITFADHTPPTNLSYAYGWIYSDEGNPSAG
jgi:hypothetical protein